MTKDNEKALYYADALEIWHTESDELEAAAHLRRLVAENEALNHYRKVYGEVSAILAFTAEMPPPSDDDEITVRRLKALVQHLEVYVDSCAAKADRIDRLGEAVVKLRSENEAKDALLRQALAAIVWECGSESSFYAEKTRTTIAAIRQHLEGKA